MKLSVRETHQARCVPTQEFVNERVTSRFSPAKPAWSAMACSQSSGKLLMRITSGSARKKGKREDGAAVFVTLRFGRHSARFTQREIMLRILVEGLNAERTAKRDHSILDFDVAKAATAFD